MTEEPRYSIEFYRKESGTLSAVPLEKVLEVVKAAKCRKDFVEQVGKSLPQMKAGANIEASEWFQNGSGWRSRWFIKRVK